VEAAVGGEGDVRGNELQRFGRVGRRFVRITFAPDDLAGGRELQEFATSRVAQVEEFAINLATNAQAVGAATEFLAERAHECSRGVEHDNGFSARACAVDGVCDVDETLRILRESLRVAPEQSLGRLQPVVPARVNVVTRAGERARLGSPGGA